MLETVQIEKLVHGGQGLGVLPDGRKVFVWNALPGETVSVRLTKKRKDYAEGIAEAVIEASKERIEPRDDAYLSTSPWQIMTFDVENTYKKAILIESYLREGIALPEFSFVSGVELGRAAGDADLLRAPRDEKPETGVSYGYRNKMEYSFWGDEAGLHLALFHRASHGKRIIQGSSIARPEIDSVANHILAVLNKKGIRASELKTVVIRCNSRGDVVAALFVKNDRFPKIAEFADICQGVGVVFSNPKSPASVLTKELYSFGELQLTEKVAGFKIRYDVHSFFQVNMPIFEEALKAIKKAVNGDKNIVDMYAGVGTIGLSVGAQKIVELDERNVQMAESNSEGRAEVVHARAEQAGDYITGSTTVIFDPPRAGLHDRVTSRLLEALPPKIVYLSCNPSTQARDIAKLLPRYKLTALTGYNFFPRTPHIESLAILEKL